MNDLVLALRRKLAGYEAAGDKEKAQRAKERISALEAEQKAATKTMEKPTVPAGVKPTPAAPAPAVPEPSKVSTAEPIKPETKKDGNQ